MHLHEISAHSGTFGAAVGLAVAFAEPIAVGATFTVHFAQPDDTAAEEADRRPDHSTATRQGVRPRWLGVEDGLRLGGADL